MGEDHGSMVRFLSEIDPGYVNVREAMEKLIAEAPEVMQRRFYGEGCKFLE